MEIEATHQGSGAGYERVTDEVSKDPMDKAHNAPRCTAKSKQSGQRSRAPPVKGWRFAGCMVPVAARRRASGMEIIVHGARTKEAIELRRLIRALGGKLR
jgi:hypothetical protein